MSKNLVENIFGEIDGVKEMTIESIARTMLLAELLIKKGVLNENDVMEALSDEQVQKIIEESLTDGE